MKSRGEFLHSDGRVHVTAVGDHSRLCRPPAASNEGEYWAGPRISVGRGGKKSVYFGFGVGAASAALPSSGLSLPTCC